MFSCLFIVALLSNAVLGQVWCFITSIPDLCLLYYFCDFSGFLDRNEIKVYLTKDNEDAKEEDVDDLLGALDTNGDGLISIEGKIL